MLKYCQERDCDPTGPPLASRLRRKPTPGEDRCYEAQLDKRYNRPYIKVPLDTLGKPGKLLVHFDVGGHAITITTLSAH